METGKRDRGDDDTGTSAVNNHVFMQVMTNYEILYKMQIDIGKRLIV